MQETGQFLSKHCLYKNIENYTNADMSPVVQTAYCMSEHIKNRRQEN